MRMIIIYVIIIAWSLPLVKHIFFGCLDFLFWGYDEHIIARPQSAPQGGRSCPPRLRGGMAVGQGGVCGTALLLLPHLVEFVLRQAPPRPSGTPPHKCGGQGSGAYLWCLGHRGLVGVGGAARPAVFPGRKIGFAKLVFSPAWGPKIVRTCLMVIFFGDYVEILF